MSELLWPQRGEARRRLRRRARRGALRNSIFLFAGATMIGLVGAGGTYALLSATAQTPSAEITAGTYNIQVNGQTAASLGTWDLTPATPVARPFTVTSVVDANSAVPSQLSAQITVPTAPAITSNMQARITPVSNAAACTVGLSGPLANLNGYTIVDLGRLGDSATNTYCLEVRLLATTPVAQSGQDVAFTLTINGNQVAL